MTLCCSITAPPATLAQQWSPAQTEVWQSVETFWNMGAAENLEGVLARVHEDYIGWDISEPMTTSKSRLRKYLEYSIRTEDAVLHDIQPVAINIFDDVAIVYYHFSVIAKDAKGDEQYQSGRWADILKRQDGNWVLIGDHGGVTSSEE